jgi:hypothetical protein
MPIHGSRRFFRFHILCSPFSNQTILLKIRHIPYTVGNVANILDFVRPVAITQYYVATVSNTQFFIHCTKYSILGTLSTKYSVFCTFCKQ